MSEKDLANGIYHEGFFYYAPLPQKGPVPKLGQRLGAITCTVAGSATPQDLATPVEGSAGLVLAGTPFFKVQACPVTVAIAARWEERTLVFVRQDASGDISGGQPVAVQVPPDCKSTIRRAEGDHG